MEAEVQQVARPGQFRALGPSVFLAPPSSGRQALPGLLGAALCWFPPPSTPFCPLGVAASRQLRPPGQLGLSQNNWSKKMALLCVCMRLSISL